MFENNEKTEMAMDAIYFEDPSSWEDDLFESTEYAMELDRRNPVLEGICEQLKRLSQKLRYSRWIGQSVIV